MAASTSENARPAPASVIQELGNAQESSHPSGVPSAVPSPGAAPVSAAVETTYKTVAPTLKASPGASSEPASFAIDAGTALPLIVTAPVGEPAGAVRSETSPGAVPDTNRVFPVAPEVAAPRAHERRDTVRTRAEVAAEPAASRTERPGGNARIRIDDAPAPLDQAAADNAKLIKEAFTAFTNADAANADSGVATTPAPVEAAAITIAQPAVAITDPEAATLEENALRQTEVFTAQPADSLTDAARTVPAHQVSAARVRTAVTHDAVDGAIATSATAGVLDNDFSGSAPLPTWTETTQFRQTDNVTPKDSRDVPDFFSSVTSTALLDHFDMAHFDNTRSSLPVVLPLQQDEVIAIDVTTNNIGMNTHKTSGKPVEQSIVISRQQNGTATESFRYSMQAEGVVREDLDEKGNVQTRTSVGMTEMQSVKKLIDRAAAATRKAATQRTLGEAIPPKQEIFATGDNNADATKTDAQGVQQQTHVDAAAKAPQTATGGAETPPPPIDGQGEDLFEEGDNAAETALQIRKLIAILYGDVATTNITSRTVDGLYISDRNPNQYRKLLGLNHTPVASNAEVLEIGAGRATVTATDFGLDAAHFVRVDLKPQHDGIESANMLALPFRNNTFTETWASFVLRQVEQELPSTLKEKYIDALVTSRSIDFNNFVAMRDAFNSVFNNLTTFLGLQALGEMLRVTKNRVRIGSFEEDFGSSGAIPLLQAGIEEGRILGITMIPNQVEKGYLSSLERRPNASLFLEKGPDFDPKALETYIHEQYRRLIPQEVREALLGMADTAINASEQSQAEILGRERVRKTYAYYAAIGRYDVVRALEEIENYRLSLFGLTREEQAAIPKPEAYNHPALSRATKVSQIITMVEYFERALRSGSERAIVRKRLQERVNETPIPRGDRSKGIEVAQVETALREVISLLPPGALLPNEQELMALFGDEEHGPIARNTLRNAIKPLTRDGILTITSFGTSVSTGETGPRPHQPDNLNTLLGQVTNQLRGLIAAGETGDMLPPERELGELYGASRYTIREAVDRLIAEGLLRTRKGSGTFITDPSSPPLEPLVLQVGEQHLPFFRRVAQILQGDIDGHVLLPNARIPSQERIAQQLGVSIPVVYQALRYLVEQGSIRQERTRYFVNEPQENDDISET